VHDEQLQLAQALFAGPSPVQMVVAMA